MRKSKTALADGDRVSARNHIIGKRLSPFVMNPDQVVEVIRKHIRKALGDTVENRADVYARSGRFHIKIARSAASAIKDEYWRKELTRGTNVRRERLMSVFRVLHGEVVTRQDDFMMGGGAPE